MNQADAPKKATSYSGYYQRGVPAPDPELTQTGPGTPMGEFFRRSWLPVCLSVELKDVPKAIRILGEDLVAFRDKSGRIGVLHRHCAHRGASLEYGIVSDKGIRCCYHGWKYDVDGRLLDAPCESPRSNLKETVTQGAYPAFERSGLVFAYMGRPEDKPEFPEFDGYAYPQGTRLIPYSNILPCNWLQVADNIMDHYHTCTLHNSMVADGTDENLAARLSLSGFQGFPVVRWEATHNGNGVAFSAARRMSDELIWIRITSCLLPSFMQVGSPTPQASRPRHSTIGQTRWTVPVDDVNCSVFGWRHFNSVVDPEGVGREDLLGVNAFDFLGGQTERPYDEAQRAPGDYEALTSQRPIAVHALEHPGTSDAGVYLYRKCLRGVVRGETKPYPFKEGTRQMYTQDSVLRIPKREGLDDQKLFAELHKAVFAIMKEGDELSAEKRDQHIRQRLDSLPFAPNALTGVAEKAVA